MCYDTGIMRAKLAALTRSAAQLPVRHGVYFALLIALTYALLLIPALRTHHSDISTFIVAGDQFVHSADTLAPIIVRPHSAGYDGQFYYAIALNPFALGTSSGGVAFDHAAWRWQRILYPFLAHFAAFGLPERMPAALLAINIAALSALALLAGQIARSMPTAGLWPWGFMLWPGFLTSLTHDTTEILACAFLLGALLAYLQKRYWRFAALAAMASLTRETSSLMLAGMLLWSLVSCVRDFRLSQADRRVALAQAAIPILSAAAALLPFLVWHAFLAVHWRDMVETAPLQANIGLPLVGVARRVALSISAMASPERLPLKARVASAYDLATIGLFILGFSTWVGRSLAPCFRHSRHGAIAAGWLAMMVLISLLSARGPWIDPTATFRAFSECWIVGCLLLSLNDRPPPRLVGLALVPLAWMNWSVCLTQLR